jgi:hypothetical protein
MRGDASVAVVGTYRSSFDAEFARSLLRSAGMESFIANDVPGARHDYIEVWVRRNDEPEARQILERVGKGNPPRADLADAVRVGFVGGAISGGFAGVLAGWLWSGVLVGTGVGILIAVKRWRSRHASNGTADLQWTPASRRLK